MDDMEIEQLEKAEKMRNLQKRYESRVPRRYYSQSFDTFRTDTEERKMLLETVKSFVQRVQNGETRILVLIGEPGTGKSHIACAAVREMLSFVKGYSYGFELYANAFYTESAAIVERVRKANSFDSVDTPSKVIGDIVHSSDLLVLDEIGRARTADEPDVLFRVMNGIYNEQKSAIFAGNFKSKADFSAYVGSAFMDRLIENGNIIELKSPSFRKELRALSA